MAYNTTTERLLNAIKTNTANTSVTLSGDVNAIDAQTKQAILDTEASNDNIEIATTQTELDTNYLVLHANGTQERGTNLASIVAATQALQTASETLQDVINAVQGLQAGSETLQTVADAITNDADLGRLATLETNSNDSLARTTEPELISNDTLIAGGTTTGTNLAVTFLTQTVIESIKFGSGTLQTSLTIAVAAGMTIYGDITQLTVNSSGTNDGNTAIIYKR
jgi:hypothetical protein